MSKDETYQLANGKTAVVKKEGHENGESVYVGGELVGWVRGDYNRNDDFDWESVRVDGRLTDNHYEKEDAVGDVAS